MNSLPPVLPYKAIHKRLAAIFPEGSPNHANCTWEIAAKTVFVMLYAGAVEGSGEWIRPDQVTRMTDAQARRKDPDARREWARVSLKSVKTPIRGRWYAANTRESIRDDTIRAGFLANGVVIERGGIATTSPLPRYALRTGFAALFDPEISGAEFAATVAEWQRRNLTPGALARVAMVREGAVAGADEVLVTYPNGETRRLAPGLSSLVSKAVVEEFAPRFLHTPTVIVLSESRNKFVTRDDALATAVGLQIHADRNLPDIVLADLGPDAAEPLLVFVEVVATAGPMTPERKRALGLFIAEAGLAEDQVTFVTAFLDRSKPAFRKAFKELAWNTFVWFASEPDHIVHLHEGQAAQVRTLRHFRRS